MAAIRERRVQYIQQIYTWIPRLSWWRHQMETFSALLALCAGNSPPPVNSPHKVQWRGALMFSFIRAWINGSVNNREAGDLRRHRTHYDVIVMCVLDRFQSDKFYPHLSELLQLCWAYHAIKVNKAYKSLSKRWEELNSQRRLAKVMLENLPFSTLRGNVLHEDWVRSVWDAMWDHHELRWESANISSVLFG